MSWQVGISIMSPTDDGYSYVIVDVHADSVDEAKRVTEFFYKNMIDGKPYVATAGPAAESFTDFPTNSIKTRGYCRFSFKDEAMNSLKNNSASSQEITSDASRIES